MRFPNRARRGAGTSVAESEPTSGARQIASCEKRFGPMWIPLLVMLHRTRTFRVGLLDDVRVALVGAHQIVA